MNWPKFGARARAAHTLALGKARKYAARMLNIYHKTSEPQLQLQLVLTDTMNETRMQTHGLMYEQHAHAIHMPSHIINNEIVMFMNILFSIHLLFAYSDPANMLMCIVNSIFAKYEISDESCLVHFRFAFFASYAIPSSFFLSFILYFYFNSLPL